MLLLALKIASFLRALVRILVICPGGSCISELLAERENLIFYEFIK
jgi:hypothetical protein